MNTDYLKKCAAKLLTEKQMSEAFLNNMFLALSGGLQDAYTYNVRDHVFSNAQTGNVVLMSQHIISGNMRSALRYLVPLVSFVLGVYISEEIHLHFKDARKLHWRQSILLLEIIILTLVGFLPEERNMLATVLVSFACAMQVQSFRKVNGYAFASTMCIGNLRSGMDSLCSWLVAGNRAARSKAFHYFAIILLFALGAGLGSVALGFCGAKAIWFSCLLLAVSFCLMFLKEDIEELEEDLEKREARH